MGAPVLALRLGLVSRARLTADVPCLSTRYLDLVKSSGTGSEWLFGLVPLRELLVLVDQIHPHQA